MKKYLILLILLILMPLKANAVTNCGDADADTWCIETSDSTFDGDTDCGGTCDSDSVITILGGARSELILRDLDGGASYITVQNADDVRVVITEVSAPYAAIELRDCKYVDLRGDNLGGETYGIKVVAGSSDTGIRVRQESDHIKTSYIELQSGGILIKDNTMPDTHTYDTFELHHNYIHDTPYSAMYLGDEDAGDGGYRPHVANFSVHHNLIENIEAYGIVLKGVKSTSGTCSIYGNILKNLGIGEENDSAKGGIGAYAFDGSVYANVYGNYIRTSEGQCMRFGDDSGHQVYENICIDNGNANVGLKWDSALILYLDCENIDLYNNLIIDVQDYAFYASSSTTGTADRNLIGNPGIGEYDPSGSGTITEGSGADANVVYSSVSSFNFDTWSNDADYTNDIYGGRNLSPANGATGVALASQLSLTRFAGVGTISIYFEAGDSSPDVLVVDDADVSGYTPPSNLSPGTTYYWQVIYHHEWGDETGSVYSFTTTGAASAPVISDTTETPLTCPNGQNPLNVTFSFTTDKDAYGRISTTNQTWDQMTSAKAMNYSGGGAAGTTTHTHVVSLACGQTISYYVAASTESGDSGLESATTEIEVVIGSEEPVDPPPSVTMYNDGSGAVSVTNLGSGGLTVSIE